MEGDISLSAILSIGIVSGLFYVAFRRFLPLIGIVLILCLSALVALALGMLIFHELNVVAIGFFSILAGVGVDFSLLLFGRYQQARRAGQSHDEAVFVSVRDIGAAIFYVIVTTAIGFLVLKFSQSSGFGQLGTLVALGVGFAGLFMVLFLFMFFRHAKPPKTTDFILIGTTRFVDAMFREPRPVLAVLSRRIGHQRADRGRAVCSAQIRHQPGFASAEEDSRVGCAAGAFNPDEAGIRPGHDPGQRERSAGVP